MHPDERTLAAAMKRTLAVAHGAKPRADVDNGWSTRRGSLPELLGGLLQPEEASTQRRRPLVQLHEQGTAPLAELLLHAGSAPDEGAVLVFGDQLGYTAEEDAAIAALGAQRATCSPRGLLTSHCIVLCHHALDAAEARAGGAEDELAVAHMACARYTGPPV